jgi:peptide/nickel transport system substrate-binding protein
MGRRLIAAIGLVSLLAVACASTAKPTKQVSVNATLSQFTAPDTLDPGIAVTSNDLIPAEQFYEGLLEYAPASTTLRPALATSWTTSADGLTYTFQLRSGVKFHDGSTLTPNAVVMSFNRIQAINQGPAAYMSDVASVTAAGSNKVAIALKAANAYFLGDLPRLFIVSPQAITDHKTAAQPWAQDWFHSNEDGTGPYTLGVWTANQSITFKEFKNYWRPFASGTPTTATYRTDANISTAIELIDQGTVDFLGALSPDQVVEAEKSSDVTIVKQPQYAVRQIFFNFNAKGPTQNPLVRQAIQLAFDYNGYLQSFDGQAQIAHGPLPSTLPGIGTVPPAEAQNVAQAKQLLTQAGYPNGGFTISYLGISGLNYEELAGTLMQQDLKAIGITLKINLLPYPQYFALQSNAATATDQLVFYNSYLETNDPNSMLQPFYSSTQFANKGGDNWAYYSNPTLDTMLNTVDTLPDASTRAQTFSQIQTAVLGAYVAIYLVEPQLYEPIAKGWTAQYDGPGSSAVLRFFFTRKTSAT